MISGKTSLTAIAVVGALAAAGATAVPASAATPKRELAQSQPDWVTHAKSTGKASPSGHSNFTVYLAPRGGTRALQATVDAISTPGSASYHHFLSASQFHARFDPTSATAAKVATWLKASGLKVLRTDAHHRSLTVTGTNAAVDKAFSTQIKRFRHQGQAVQANATGLSVPAGLSASIAGVSGLDTTNRVVKHAPRPRAVGAGFRNAPPCSSYYGEKQATTLPKFKGKTLPYVVCGYTGKQYRSAYTGNTAYDGSGKTVAIVDAFASPTIASDASTYAQRNGDRAYTSGQLTETRPGHFRGFKQCDYTGWYGEETLDVEAVHAMAQGANIHYYGARSCYDSDILVTVQKVVDDNDADLVSNSYGEPENASDPALEAQYHQVFLQAATQGISFLFSSGDDGDEKANTGTKQADASANDPAITAVGGTSDAIGSDGSFLWQSGWGTKKGLLNDAKDGWNKPVFQAGAGGGVSKRWAQPSYQQGVVPAAYSAGRAVPDVAMDADPNTGFRVGQTQQFPEGVKYDEYRIGGTSLASPLFAGLTALRAQAKGGRLGFLNPTIYQHRSTFTDVTGVPGDKANARVDYVNTVNASDGLVTSVRTFGQDSSLPLLSGWDPVTGLGAGNAGWITAP